MLMQTALREWPAQAVHDTVRAVLRTEPYRRSFSQSVFERVMRWVGQALQRLYRHFEGSGSARTVAIGLAILIVLAVATRLVLAARDERSGSPGQARARRSPGADDPWRLADELASGARFAEAAHALYRGVLASLAERERLRLDASKTSGDYARELRRRGSASLAPFRAFCRRFDAAAYGHDVCDARLIDELRALAEPFAPRSRAA